MVARIRKHVSKKPILAWYSKLGNAAQIASAVIAFFGFTIVIAQLYMAREKASEESARAELADARRLYVSYSEADLKYPQLSDPDCKALMLNHAEFVRYKNFVSFMIYAYDEIFNAVAFYNETDDEDEWVASFETDVRPHQRYLCQADLQFLSMYRPEMRARLDELNQKRCKDVEPLVIENGAPSIPPR